MIINNNFTKISFKSDLYEELQRERLQRQREEERQRLKKEKEWQKKNAGSRI